MSASDSSSNVPFANAVFFLPEHGFLAFAPLEAPRTPPQRLAGELLGAPWTESASTADDAPKRLRFAREVLRAALATQCESPKRAEPLWRVAEAEWAALVKDRSVMSWLERRARQVDTPDPAQAANALVELAAGELVCAAHAMVLALISDRVLQGRAALHVGAIKQADAGSHVSIDFDLAMALGWVVPSHSELRAVKHNHEAIELLKRIGAALHRLSSADVRALRADVDALAARVFAEVSKDDARTSYDELRDALDAIERWYLNQHGCRVAWNDLARARCALASIYDRHEGRELDALNQQVLAAALDHEPATRALAQLRLTNPEGLASARESVTPERLEQLSSARAAAPALEPKEEPQRTPFRPIALCTLERGWERWRAHVETTRGAPLVDRWTARRWFRSREDGWIKAAAVAGLLCASAPAAKHVRAYAAQRARDDAYASFADARRSAQADRVRAAARAFLSSTPRSEDDARVTEVENVYREALLDAARKATSDAELAQIVSENRTLAARSHAHQSTEDL